MKTARTFLVTGIAVAALAAGCGGDDEPSATESWAGDVCSSVTTWQESIASATESLKDDPSAESVQSAVDEITTATRTLADDLKESGAPPETESRSQADELLTTLADDLGDALDTVEQEIESAQGTAGALTAGAAIVTTLTTAGQQVSSTVDELEQLDAGEISDAFDNADACRELRDNG